jgi:hypothetical protein
MSTFYYKKAAKVTKIPTKVTFDYKNAAKVTKPPLKKLASL